MDTIDYLHKFKKETGIKLGIASGRGLTGIMPILIENHIDDIISVAVCAGGALLVDFENNTSKRINWVRIDQIKNVIERLDKIDGVSVTFHNENCVFYTKFHPYVNRIVTLNNFEGKYKIGEKEFKETARLVILLEDERKYELQKVMRQIEFPGLRGSVAEPFIYEIINKDVSKLSTIEEYVTKNGDTLDNVMAFGDSENDMEMLQGVGSGVCMVNGLEECKRIAKYVTEYSNDENGIIRFLEKYRRNEL